MWSEGDTVLWRSVSFGHVRFAMPHRLVALSAEEVVLWVPPGTQGKRFAGRPLSEVERLEENDWSLADAAWRGGGCLRVTRFGRAHSIFLFWTVAGEPEPGWYVNLQDPLRATPLGWDTRDHALDLLVRQDGTWTRKDEDHLAAAVGYGHIEPNVADAIRAEGERVVREWPFPTGWEDWQPDAGWPIPTLPDGWDGVF